MSEKKLTPLQKNILDCLAKGMTTKEIVSELGCAESTVKGVRANKELTALHEEANTTKSGYDAIKEIIPEAVEEMRQIFNNPNASINERIAASKQLIELCKITEELFPPPVPEHVIRVVYE